MWKQQVELLKIMRPLILIAKIILTILFVLNSLIWFAAQGSGHNIPLRTNVIFGIVSFIFLILLIFFIYWGDKKKAKSDKELPNN